LQLADPTKGKPIGNQGGCLRTIEQDYSVPGSPGFGSISIAGHAAGSTDNLSKDRGVISGARADMNDRRPLTEVQLVEEFRP
jgi:hypothetical protein